MSLLSDWWERLTAASTDTPRVCEDSIEGLAMLARETGCVYVHGDGGRVIATVLPVPGWWHDALPDAPDPPHPAWNHEHVDVHGRVP